MSQDNLVKLQCTKTGHIRYTRKNKKTSTEKLELRKFNPVLREQTVYREIKK